MTRTFRSALLAAAAAAAVGAGFAAPAAACIDTPYIGAVCFFAGNFCPQGYLPADGRLLAIQQNPALYSIVGTIYGGDGKSTFALPDLRGRGPIGPGTGPGLAPVTLGQPVGSAQVTLTANNIPPHTHPAAFSSGSITGTTTGNVTIPVTFDSTTTTLPVTGSVSVKALSVATTGGANTPTPTNNTVGRVNAGSLTFYPPNSATDVATPATASLSASASSLKANATGPAQLTVAGTASGTVTVAPNQTTTAAVATRSPSLGLTTCIAELGLYPPRP